jgi:hypothetical protein
LSAALLAACVAGAIGSAAEEAPADPANPFGRKYPARVYQTVRLQSEPPVVDGRLDDAAWGEGEWSGNYTQQLPTEGAEPTHPTELKILYDDRHVYVAIRAFDDPDAVHRYPGRRDAFTGDIVGVCFDSYNDKRTGFEFDLTAGGSKIDLILGNGETEWDTTWDAVWDGEVAHDERGWTAEFRVPLSQLRYGPQEEQVWGLHAWRWIDRYQEESQWQLIPRQNTGRMYNLGELHGISGLHRTRHLELLPHVVGKAASGPDASSGGGSSATGGLDLKLGVTTNFTLDATVNPDFGQVEADPSVVNLTAYETFYDEKRPFFLEGKKILSLDLEGSDQLFYSRRIGQGPLFTPELGEGETLRSPEATATILGAVKLTGKTPGGLSVGVLQTLTQRESAGIHSPAGSRDQVVAPFGSYTVARMHKDWDHGITSLGGMLTSTHRWISDPALAFLPTQATTGGIDVSRHFGDRAWGLAATGVFSHVTGDRQAIRALQTNPVHFYQRPDADHLGVEENATSLSGFGASLRFGRSEQGRFRFSDQLYAYSPGLDLNDLGYLRQADVIGHQVFLGWVEPAPRGIFREYSFELSREDEWDFGGLATRSETELEASAQLRNRWRASGSFAFHQEVDTRALRGGPALRRPDYFAALASAGSDSARRVRFSVEAERAWSIDDDSRLARHAGRVDLRPTDRLSLSAQLSHESRSDAIQYVTSVDAPAGPRWILGRIDQETWAITLRANLSLTPELTVQYYGSPFIGTGRYTALKRAADTLASRYQDRFHAFTDAEIASDPSGGGYRVSEPDGSAYAFPDPDFSFRQFRSNLVVRWEYQPGSALYAVWSQGRSGAASAWVPAFSSNWDALWGLPADDVFLVKLSYWFSP